jgi:hypothetical protein
MYYSEQKQLWLWVCRTQTCCEGGLTGGQRVGEDAGSVINLYKEENLLIHQGC